MHTVDFLEKTKYAQVQVKRKISSACCQAHSTQMMLVELTGMHDICETLKEIGMNGPGRETQRDMRAVLRNWKENRIKLTL